MHWILRAAGAARGPPRPDGAVIDLRLGGVVYPRGLQIVDAAETSGCSLSRMAAQTGRRRAFRRMTNRSLWRHSEIAANTVSRTSDGAAS